MNDQKPTSCNKSATHLRVHSIFATIQAEGPFSGHRAIFVRLAGCNLQCPACDTNYNKPDAAEMAVPEVAHEVAAAVAKQRSLTHTHKSNLNLVVITGGEPFNQDATALLCNTLSLAGYNVQVECNGTKSPKEPLHPDVAIVCSPKTHQLSPWLVPNLAALKYVINADHIDEDGLPMWALHSQYTRPARPPKGFTGNVYILPEDTAMMGGNVQERNAKNVRACVNMCEKYGYVMQLQIHKLVGIE